MQHKCSVCGKTRDVECFINLLQEGWYVDIIGKGRLTMCKDCYDSWKNLKGQFSLKDNLEVK